ncbi:MAG: orotate phosphoribosyltransferase [Lautropia sp.]|nr:orotate phosphoribosyltransferase [Lautropia sp.]
MSTLSHEFIQFAIDTGALRFGEFKTKAGRLSPYFFNAGLFHDGATLGRLAGFYADKLLAVEASASQAGDTTDGAATPSQAPQVTTPAQLGADRTTAPLAPPQFDVLFGPAYKGITLASAMAVACAARGRNLPFAFNRKEAKDHGEGGVLVGAPLKGRVAIIDDVISAGTSVRESVEIIQAAGATPAAVFIAIDRMERAGTAEVVEAHSAVEEVRQRYGLAVYALATLDDLLGFIDAGDGADQPHAAYRTAISDYRRRYGVGAQP